MGLSYTTIKNLSNEFREYPPGCIPCQINYKPGNPGTFEDLHSKFDSIESKHFEGARLIVKNILSKHFDATHAISMNPKSMTPYNKYKNSLNQKALTSDKHSASINNRRKIIHDSDDGYKFGVSYTGLKKVNQERYPQFYGDIKPNGDLVANFSHTLGCRLRVKLDTAIKKNKYESLKATTEYRTDDCTITASVIDPSIIKQEGLLLLQYLQAITTRLAMGFEIALNKQSALVSGKQTNLACAFRYSNGFQTATATVGESALRICYHHKQSHHLQMGVEFQSNFVRNESKTRVLFQVAPPAYDFVFRGFVDSNFLIGAVLEHKLYPIAGATFLMSGLFDHNKSDISVGVGVTVEK